MPIVTPSLNPRTALMVIEDALGLTNAVGVDQTLTADETSDCLRKLNDLLDLWSAQKLAVYGIADQSFSTVATQASYTIGPAGNWNTDRPVRINEPVYATISGVTYLYSSITQQEYDQISYKAQPGGGTDLDQYFLYVNDNPLGIVTLWPVPDSVFTITLSIDRLLTTATTAATVMAFPPGYFHAFTHSLAPILAPMFGKQASPDVKNEANRSFGAIKRANQKPTVLQYDNALLTYPSNGYPDYP